MKRLLVIFLFSICFCIVGCKNENTPKEEEIKFTSEGLVFNLNQSNDGYIVTGYTKSFKYIKIPNEYNSLPVKEIATAAFQNSNVEILYFGKNIKDMGWYCFDNCTNLKEFKVDENNLYYEVSEGVLYSKGKTTLVAYPIGKELDEFVIPDTVEELGYFCFDGVKYLKKVTLSSKIKVVEGSAFNNAKELKTVILPENLKEITRNAFSNCENLETITLPNSLEKISSYAFYNCSSLKEIYIPKSVKSMGERAFYECDSVIIKCAHAKRPNSWSYEWVERKTTVLWNQ